MSRFSSAAISFGSVSIEAFNTIIRAMNRLGARSNCGEGGQPENGQVPSVRQVASGRFGVSLKYICEAKELQIKIGQGSKPGEGGELPWYKMDEEVARTRHCTSWVADRSPAPHHDVYSVEDLSQLVYDLKSVNPTVEIGLKLVSSHGVGVIATGAVKSGAKSVTISGHGGGTGGSTWTGIKNSGMPWEFGVAETHKLFVETNIRDNVSLEIDGQLQTGVDVVKAALFGADKFSFGTCVMIAIGCTMCRKCHLNTCHVGISTQDRELRKRYKGREDAIVNYFTFVVNEVRHIMSRLGIRYFSELIGRTDLLKVNNVLSEKAKYLDFSLLIGRMPKSLIPPQYPESFEIKNRLEYGMLKKIKSEIARHVPFNLTFTEKIKNTDRSFGAIISGFIYRLRKFDGELPDECIRIELNGTAGQSFGAFLSKGVTLTLNGEVNDFAGKGLSGGKIVVRPFLHSNYKSNENIIGGNVLLYGAISGTAYFCGLVGERFCVRNSGATAVCEGCGDHGCEYMTAGLVVIIGRVGHNFAAGMAGGVIYVNDVDETVRTNCNMAKLHIESLDHESKQTLFAVLRDFAECTGSETGKSIINNFDTASERFIKIVSHDSEMHQRIIKSSSVNSEMSTMVAQEFTHSENSTDEDVYELCPDLEDTVLDRHRGFMLYRQKQSARRHVKERIRDLNEIVDITSLETTIKSQASRCINCGVPFCQSEYGCPLGVVIPDLNKLVTENDWRSALQRILQSNNFPEFTGRVCPAVCESACVFQPDPVTIRNIELVIAEYGFAHGYIVPEVPVHRTGHTVSIVGAGPSGLAAAAQLNKAGHYVRVYDQSNDVGGLLRYGILTTRLNRNIIDRRVNLLRKEGIIFLVNYKIEEEQLDELLKSSSALILAIGSDDPGELVIKGRYLENISMASTFLASRLNSSFNAGAGDNLIVKDRNVLVIGSINFTSVTADCVSALIREGVQSLHCMIVNASLIASSSAQEAELTAAREEAKEQFHDDIMIYDREFVGDSTGKVSAVRFVPAGNASTELEQKCDMVLICRNQNEYGPCVNPLKYYTSSLLRNRPPHLFTCGDCYSHAFTIAHAIADGRRAARQVDLFLMGDSYLAASGGIVKDVVW